MKNLMLQDMQHEDHHGLCFIDLHGDAAYELLAIVPRERIPDVIYYDPTSPYAPAFNFLRWHSMKPAALTEDLNDLFRTFAGGAWGKSVWPASH